MGSATMRFSFLAAALCVLMHVGCGANLGESLSESDVESVGVNLGAKFWRVYSVTKTGSNEGWQLAKIGFYEKADGSGTPVAGKYRASSVKDKHKAEMAFDGSDATYWQASSGDKD